MTRAVAPPHDRRPSSGWGGAIAASCLVVIVTCAASAARPAVAGDDDSDDLGAVRLSGAVHLEPVPIDSASSRAGSEPAESVTPPWFDPRLSVVLVALAIVVLSLRWSAGRSGRTLPPDVFTLLGEVSLGGTHSARVVRFGPKTLLVGVSGSACTTLAEIDDAAATDRIVAACRADATAARIPSIPARWLSRSRPAATPLPAEATP